MFKKIIIVFLSFSILLSCSSIYVIDQNDSNNNIAVINLLGSKYKSLVKLTDGTEFYSKSIQIRNDSLFTSEDLGKAIPLDIISTIKLKDTWDGFADGIFLGMPIGIATLVISINLDLGFTSLLTTIGSYLVAIIVTMTKGHNKTFVFERNVNNTFTYIK